MRALTWQGREQVAVEDVPDPRIEEPTDAVVRVTSTAICGSDLHLYSVLGPYLKPGDVLGHETMGVVEEVGPQAAGRLSVGDRVVVPFGIACGTCFMCTRGLQSQCETTQVREQGKGAALFGYTSLYGSVPGGQAQYLRVPQAQYGPVVVPADGRPDEAYLYLSDVLPTAWQAVVNADVPAGGTVVVVGLGPIGQMAARIARHRGAGRVVGIDGVPERLAMARRHGVETIDAAATDDVVAAVRDLTQGRGADGVVEAVGMEAHGSPVFAAGQKVAGLLPDALAQKFMEKAGVDRMAAMQTAIGAARRGGTVSVVGVYGGAVDPFPMMDVFDRQLTFRFGQANVRRWTDELLPLVTDDADPLGVLDLRTHRVPLEQAPAAYDMFQRKSDGCVKVVLDPAA
ncbi:alcohol dehydrogenase catalytic domain-containing protein [Cellulomonas oligotrophica]|uniref:Glutathione-dependent formaldehyde dehydrogenase n=1 Tax=Cellulomonas oligotrophica TaxID=931536 RepID=A0A7Y9FDL5_9CELL|nr:alcohol dehydrogenase catalytic domain-containing protein [Cellulomonas oligotrophica]NYD85275.1 threonine dehydrogenase-like Zn-dependent dehydrogenase [Cellulomonas oligotrophica]GIG33288.1 glutathione-dependent formaldehyde dehydrogenase [Cellulomonas oligotrophica]